MGYDVIGVVKVIPDLDEPWRHGVTWRPEPPADADADATVGWSHDTFGSGRSVVLQPPGAQSLAIGSPSVILEADFDALPIEQSAMAALRAAVETEHVGSLSHDQVAYLGDAMMLQ